MKVDALENVFGELSSVISKCSSSCHYEVYISSSTNTYISYFMKKPESIVSSKKVAAGIRFVYGGSKSACVSVSISDDMKSVECNLRNAISAALIAIEQSPEDFNTPVMDSKAIDVMDLGLEDDNPFNIGEAKNFALSMELAASSYDSKISLVEQASVNVSNYEYLLANSIHGIVGQYKKSVSSGHVSVVANDVVSGSMENGYAFSKNCKCSNLRSPSDIGKEAAERAMSRLGSSVLKSGHYPIIIEQRIAGDFLEGFASAINGVVVATGGSFLAGCLGGKVFNDSVVIVDNSTIPHCLYSRPFDGECLIGRNNEVVGNGVLQTWILDKYHANKLRMNGTASAYRSLDASIFPDVTNFYIENSNIDTNSLISDITYGVYITELIGFGINIATGDYSQGASGFLIENGVKTRPVHGFTIAGNLRKMFRDLYVGSDLILDRKVNSPTIFIPNVVVAGS